MGYVQRNLMVKTMEELSFAASHHRSWRCEFTGEPTKFFDSLTWSLGMAVACTSALRYPCSSVNPWFFHVSPTLVYISVLSREWFQLINAFWLWGLQGELLDEKHKALTWKRTWIWSTSPIIQRLDLGCLTAEERPTTVKTTTSWTDPKTGKKKFQGNRHLKGTQYLWVHNVYNFDFELCWPQNSSINESYFMMY